MLQVSISQVCYAIELPVGCSYVVRLTKWELLNNHQNRLKHNNQVSWILQVWRCGGVEVLCVITGQFDLEVTANLFPLHSFYVAKHKVIV